MHHVAAQGFGKGTQSQGIKRVAASQTSYPVSKGKNTQSAPGLYNN